MSKHSKNCTAQTIFTYSERQKLKNLYGTIQTRIGQDSVKKFEDCTICHSRVIQPTSCDHGHIFCRSCVIQFIVKQKKKHAAENQQTQKLKEQQTLKNRQKQLQKKVEQMQKFEKYDNFLSVTERNDLFKNEKPKDNKEVQKIDLKNYVKPTGIYQENKQKDKYIKTSFWALQNAPQLQQKVADKAQKFVQCPGSGSKHKLTLKKLRDLKINELDNTFCCWICRKQIAKQKIGCFKCGHLVCVSCKSDKCEICQMSQKWLQVEGNSTGFASHNSVEIKTYTHAFMS